MIDPTEGDVGRKVIYRGKHHGCSPEEGVLTSFNAHVAFVRYGSDYGSKATKWDDLEWIDRASRDLNKEATQ